MKSSLIGSGSAAELDIKKIKLTTSKSFTLYNIGKSAKEWLVGEVGT